MAKSKVHASTRSLKYLRSLGYMADVCERFIGFGNGGHGFRKDLFGFADLLAVTDELPGVLAVQATSKKQISKHLREYRTTPEVCEALRIWAAAGNRCEIHGWDRVEVPCRTKAGTKPKWIVIIKDVIEEVVG
jgi:hypothetical protein